MATLSCRPRMSRKLAVSGGLGSAQLSVRLYSSSVSGALRCTRVFTRPQTIKPNPAHTSSAKFDRSFEKLSSEIENRLPFRQQQILFGSKYDRNFGEESQDELRKAAAEDLFGQEPERAAARQARSYFTGDDLSPAALHVRSPRLKVAQLQHRQAYDKSILKTSREPSEYYYRRDTTVEHVARRRLLYALASGVGVVACWGLYRL
ncbi:unnamed protein product [Trypanosoma congolense IL3000]|uniref:WGS project CAEQ00000000 data, annotated contig 284 n=1 Tax=Trypanosoma congolense (strain IL3000) TaxID=1068625 RepID=F9WEK8_TRYCI|nr:unnamed protein product [Trypanosoma congolense IL3000]